MERTDRTIKRKQWKAYCGRVDWMGLFGAAALFRYGMKEEPMAAVLGGVIFFTDMIVFLLSKKEKINFF